MTDEVLREREVDTCGGTLNCGFGDGGTELRSGGIVGCWLLVADDIRGTERVYRDGMTCNFTLAGHITSKGFESRTIILVEDHSWRGVK